MSIDVARYGRIISIKINGFATVTVEDGIAMDGVVHMVSNVLIPPKQLGGVEQQYEGEDLTVEDLKDRLNPYLDHDSEDEIQEL